MKAKEELKQIREMSEAQCVEELVKLERELLNLKFRKVTGGITKPSELKRIRAKIARIETVRKETQISSAA